MRFGFVVNDKEREWDLARAFIDGLDAHGIEGHILKARPTIDLAGFNAVGMVGVKSLPYWKACEHLGITPIMFDKGYARHKVGPVWEYWRVSIGAHQPTRYLMDRDMPPDRFQRLDLDLLPWKTTGEHVLLAGSSEKYHRFQGLPHPTAWARQVVANIREKTKAPIVYRPKPSWRAAEPIGDTTYSGDRTPLSVPLKRAQALVTHGSSACFEAVLAGVPVVILGDAVAKPISSASVVDLVRPNREQWLANLAYCQWTLDEFQSGEAWATMKEQMAA